MSGRHRGGSGPGECWERGPYYVAGLLPLAELLNDDALRAKAAPWIEWTLASQRDDGFLRPARNRDWWPRMVMLPVLVWHHAATGDERVPPFVERYLRFAHDTLPDQPLEMWAAARGAELIPTVLWCHERPGTRGCWILRGCWSSSRSTGGSSTGTSRTRSRPPVSLGRFLRAYLPPPHRGGGVGPAVASGQADPGAHRGADRKGECVGAAELLSPHARGESCDGAGAGSPMRRWWRGRSARRRAAGSRRGPAVPRQRGRVVTADEHLAGRSPVHGIETCSVVETMRSFEELLRITGDGSWADRLDEVGLNALPAALTPDLSGHQYYQQVNQVEVSRRRRPWFNGGRDGTLFGLEPTYGCCTANLHQGWPRLAASAVMRSLRDDGLVVTGLLPVRVGTEVAGSVVSPRQSEYPFDGRVRVVVSAAQPHDVSVAGCASPGGPATCGCRSTVRWWSRMGAWLRGSDARVGEADRVELELPMPVRSTPPA